MLLHGRSQGLSSPSDSQKRPISVDSQRQMMMIMDDLHPGRQLNSSLRVVSVAGILIPASGFASRLF
ncbi:hypothetical protein BDW74DRAFT_151346 [Aspergillus multicolor]|uniref:uncharacterized protein n=1 Tax=Aspergillus multicolor TaxID=41759 RepID=UPI003CCD8353